MRAVSRGSAAVAAVLAALGIWAASAPAQVVDGYCSPTGDYCTSVVSRAGVTYLGITTFSFTGKYKLCTGTEEGHGRKCKRFRLRKQGDTYRSFVRFEKQFSPAEIGDYCASWHKFGARLGPKVCFAFSSA